MNFQFSIFNFQTVSRWFVLGSVFLVLGSMLLFLPGCKVYSFTGASIPADIKTVQVDLFQNRAGNGPASISQTFTDRLKLKMQTEANLRQVSTDGDLVFSGSITGFVFTSDAPVAGATSGLNKLTITVQVHYVNTKDPKDTWDLPFSGYVQYSASEELLSVQDRLITDINNQLVDYIFQKALVKW
ncbi:MAG: hypothetical protein RLZZ367_1038 [Bacteroidota bacterium]|jgi:hypothetical protein